MTYTHDVEVRDKWWHVHGDFRAIDDWEIWEICIMTLVPAHPFDVISKDIFEELNDKIIEEIEEATLKAETEERKEYKNARI